MKAIAIAWMALAATLFVAGCGPSASELRGYDIERDQSTIKENDAATFAVKADQAKVDAQTQATQTATAALAAMPNGPAKWGAAARVLGFEARDEQYLVNGAVQSSTHYIKGEWRDPPKPARKTKSSYPPDSLQLSDSGDVLHYNFPDGSGWRVQSQMRSEGAESVNDHPFYRRR